MISNSPEETVALGRDLSSRLPKGAILFLEGDLGAGKTTLIKGIVEGRTGLPSTEVTSPTFTLLNIYDNQVYHFDLYRLRDADDFLSMGFDEHLYGDGICCIEWSERIANLVDSPIRIRLSHLSETQREIEVEGLA